MKKITFLLAALVCGAWCATAQTTANGHEWVDLGLPSGLKWATCNVGAATPEEYGNYYAWGETEPKTTYSWSTYKYGTASNQLTKYCPDASYGKDGFTDDKTVLDPEDDAACANWGGAWRMPTDAEWTELRENCTWTWKTLNEVDGYEVKGTNGNSIFLPAAGYRNYDDLYDTGGSGYYWSSSLRTGNPYGAWLVGFLSGDAVYEGYDNRYYGQSVRPVINAAEPQKIDLGLPSGTKWADCNVGATKPEEYGNYYAWGETEPKTTYSWTTYKYGSDYNKLTKYCTRSGWGKDGFTDNKTVLDPEDDAARANWGDAWRMPTDAEWKELIDNCTWTWKTLNEVNGYEVKGTNGNSIFLPAAGCLSDNGLLYADYGFYWSSSLDANYPADARCMNFESSFAGMLSFGRYFAQPVRPVIKETGGTTALQPATAAAQIYATVGRIVCEGDFRIYDLLGRDVTRQNGSLNGVYVVKTADSAVKIAVK